VGSVVGQVADVEARMAVGVLVADLGMKEEDSVLAAAMAEVERGAGKVAAVVAVVAVWGAVAMTVE
jgi:hypothetical protein